MFYFIFVIIYVLAIINIIYNKYCIKITRNRFYHILLVNKNTKARRKKVIMFYYYHGREVCMTVVEIQKIRCNFDYA